ncbi:MAG: UvrD-helicase domain-containing protein [Gammaproteobacteria bacterium]|nr:UvrD-helicase domain-containing protein [Gammaproteobacteria bacterium]
MTNYFIAPDEPQRQRALTPNASFIVQAPAGSGKTELLTQRVLMLLAHVNAPEEILAITFTKKASFEMRARIINALKIAAHESEPLSPHAKKTWHLARLALAKDQELKWNLLTNPNRLRIQTIDSFNASLIKHLPILSHFGAPPEISDDTHSLYQEAVEEFLSHLEENVEWADAIAQLLLHLDNDLNKVQRLLINMLAKRDQWLPYIMIASDPDVLRDQLETQLAAIVTDALTQLEVNFPKEHIAEMLTLARFAGHNLKTECADLTELPGHDLEDAQAWKELCELLFTKDFNWRKRLDKNCGFPAPSTSKNKDEKETYTSMKERMGVLITKLSEHDILRLAASELNSSPAHFYHESQWQALSALYQILRIVVAQLQVVFRTQGKIDYIENAQAALFSLGTDDAPTDLALALDYQIKHVLIDEFQDTSNSQYRLLEKLTAGWENNDGRTLFVVGDPMQSIYRFREAEVGLFIGARKTGIGHLKLEPLTLTVNFRSTKNVVTHINQYFKTILPTYEDIATGAVSYSTSSSCQSDDAPDSNVHLHPVFESENAQANSVIALINKSKKSNPNGSIAILVRSRTHLNDIIPALKKANIAFRAIDIDRLNTRSVIQDLISLTRALLFPEDRIAWLSVLRAPWCGFSLKDLLEIAGNNPQQILLDKLKNYTQYANLTPQGQKQLARVMPIFQNKIAARRRHSLRAWVESTWLLLGGPACIDESSDLKDIKEFFLLLEKLDQGSELKNIDSLMHHVSQLFASPNNQSDNTLQIMTIHNAKGLEFDTVILPHLERKSPNEDKQLLLWMERSREKHRNALILAPIHAAGSETDSIYSYIKQQHAIKMDYETGRLLYVAATRAKKNLHLFFNLEISEKDHTIVNPTHKSLLEKLWPAIKNTISLPDKQSETESVQANSQQKERHIKRIALDWQNPIHEEVSSLSSRHQSAPGFALHQDNPKYIGIVIHKIFQQMGMFGINWWRNQSEQNQNSYIQHHLMQQGILTSSINKSILIVKKAITNTLQDKRGLWIFQPHTQTQSELSLTTVIDNEVKPLIIDRTFIDESGTRWIIDYKTTDLSDTSLEEFLQSEHEKYAKQLQQYQQALEILEARPIRLALYFPLIPAWHEWVAQSVMICSPD